MSDRNSLYQHCFVKSTYIEVDEGTRGDLEMAVDNGSRFGTRLFGLQLPNVYDATGGRDGEASFYASLQLVEGINFYS